MAEAVGGDERLHVGLPQDVPDLLGAVEVHDGHDDGTEIGHAVERCGRFEPVRELERDGVPRFDATRVQSPRDAPGQRVDVTERAAVRLALRVHREGMLGCVVQPRRQHGTEALVLPKPLLDVALRVVRGSRARAVIDRPARHPGFTRSIGPSPSTW